MRVNVYAEELPDRGNTSNVERGETVSNTGQTFSKARLYLCSAEELYDRSNDDDRSAVTVWGPREKVAMLLRLIADKMDRRMP